MEGEGSFSVKYYPLNNKRILVSEVSQRKESRKLFNYLTKFLKILPADINCPEIILKYLNNLNINIKEYKDTNKIKLTLSSIDYFY